MYSDDILHKINGLRQKLIHVANQKGKFTDDEVVQVSQQLDIYILEFQKYYKKQQQKDIVKKSS
ncbi:aspartyl-phosphate phosphatase Spo0E family protein [Paenibacillus dendritiformis]|uniref:aspartyl-phosphate phosphatase Spo0E family protein n=1 Tax=Paenibacillus dendritiformis TaxID=130049 RepID=UPI0031F4B7FD